MDVWMDGWMVPRQWEEYLQGRVRTGTSYYYNVQEVLIYMLSSK